MSKMVRFLAVLGILAAVLGGVADTLLLYSPTGGYLKGDYHFLQKISFQRLLWGHYLGIVFIPLEVLGFALVVKALPSRGDWRPVAGCLGLVTLFAGVCYHATVGMLGITMHQVSRAASSQAWSQHLRHMLWFSEPLGAVVIVGFALLSLGWAWMVWKGQTGYPKWMAFLNPLSLYGLLALPYWVVPVLGRVTLPAGFNLSIGLFLLLSLLYARPLQD